MNIEHKKTALDDSASIYSRNRAAANKENIKNLPFKQKVVFFLDYYSKALIVGVIILAMAISLLNTMVFNRTSCVLSISCLNDIQIIDSEAAQDELRTYLDITDKNEYTSISYYGLDDPNMNMAFVAHVATGATDIILCSEEYFTIGSEQGMFADLSTFLPEDMYKMYASDMLEGTMVKYDVDGTVLETGEPTEYGIRIAGSKKFAEYSGFGEDPILCVLGTSKNTDNVLKTITWLTEK